MGETSILFSFHRAKLFNLQNICHLYVILPKETKFKFGKKVDVLPA